MATQTVVHSVRQSKPRTANRTAIISRVRFSRLVRYVRAMPCCYDGTNSHTPGSHNPSCRKHALLKLLGVKL
jgi:hypothetical protein